MPFVPIVHRDTCHRLHLLALSGTAPLLSPGYARRDRDLRRAAVAALTGDVAQLDGDVAAQLSASAPPAAGDDAWFATRWDAGEGAANLERATALALTANALPAAALLPPTDIEVLVSQAVELATARPGGPTAPWRVVAGPRAAGELLVVATVAAQLRRALPDLPLSPEDAEVLYLHLAASALVRLPEMAEHLDRLLETAGVQLLPLQGRRPAAVAQLRRLNDTVLAQPYGEVERIGAGFHRDRTDRLHRAWLRGFFTPRGFDLDAWVRARATAR